MAAIFALKPLALGDLPLFVRCPNVPRVLVLGIQKVCNKLLPCHEPMCLPVSSILIGSAIQDVVLTVTIGYQ